MTIPGSDLHHGASLSSWLMKDDIDDGLAADFDGSLSGLGVEMGTATYNMRCGDIRNSLPLLYL